MNLAETLIRLVRSAMDASRADECLISLGFGQTLFEKLHGEIADAIYYLIGENSSSFDDSTTFLALTASDLSTDDRVSILLSEYEKNHLSV